MKTWIWMLMMSVALIATEAQAARRFGGGKSFGQQSNNVTQRYSAPNAPAKPNQAAPNNGKNPTAPAAAAPKRPWSGMLGGLAAGLGLAWLASALGLGEAMAQFMTFALLALLVMLAVGWLRRSRQPTRANASTPFAFEGSGNYARATTPANYRPENVGNDSSARPWEQNGAAFEAKCQPASAGSGSIIGSGLSGCQTWGIPAGFDTESFLNSAKANFKTLQCAWDKADIAALRLMMTDAMLEEIQSQLAEREAHTGGPVNLTEVVMIEAHLLGIEDLGGDYMASVEFSGMIREQPSSGAAPFREVWNMTKPKDGQSGWLVAGVQALQ